MMPIQSDLELRSRIDRVGAVLRASAQFQRRGIRQNTPASAEVARARRILSELAWDVLTDADPAASNAEARQPMDGLAEKPSTSTVECLVAAACQLVLQALPADPQMAAQLFQCGVRPQDEVAQCAPGASSGEESSPADPWAHLLQSISSVIYSTRPDPLLLEALAGLLRLNPHSQMPAPTNLPANRISYNGLYLLTRAAHVVGHLGPSQERRPKALCRCGRSESKPYCDGSHVAAEFSGAEDFRREPHHRDAYFGQPALTFDNMGLCAHSGFCTDRLNGVFHLGEEPFVTPSRARFDDIIRAVLNFPVWELLLKGERVNRRLAAVLSADVAGYSRLMGADEVGTLEALKAHRRELVDPAIAEHKGRIVKTTGDGMLVEFASVVDAVTCAMVVQEKMAERNRATEPRISFRIGINIGDIIIDGDDIFGDGVNVAARVASECEPGAVCLSGSAFDQVRGKTDCEFDDLGEKTLKNIERPVRLYALRQSGTRATEFSAAAAAKLLALQLLFLGGI
jgi:class 3 adenylate cyclase/CDGSH-type Zn-finger protein